MNNQPQTIKEMLLILGYAENPYAKQPLLNQRNLLKRDLIAKQNTK